MYKTYKYVIYIWLGLFSFNSLFAQEKADGRAMDMLDKKRFQIEEEIKDISSSLESIKGKQKNSSEAIILFQKKIDSRKQVVSTIDKQIYTLQNQLSNKQAAIEILKADLDNLKKSYASLLNQYYSFSNKTNWLMYIMASENVSQAYRRMKHIREILVILKAQADKIGDMTNQLNAEIAEMSRKQNLLNNNLSDKNKEVATLQAEERQSKDVFAALKKQERDLSKQLETRRKEYEGLNAEVKLHMKKEIDRTIEMGISDETLLAAKSFEQAKGILSWPTMGVIVAQFGSNNKHAVYKQLIMPTNYGIDIQASANADVYSIYKGKVSSVSPIKGMGLSVIVQHGSYSTVYARLTSVNVKKGDEVNSRQKIGSLDNKAEVALLQFQIWHGMDVLNPEEWILK